MTARSRLTALTLLLIALTATSSLEAREVLRYAPPAGESEGVIRVDITTGDDSFTMVQGADVAEGNEVRVHLELDTSGTVLYAHADITDADEAVVDSYTDSVAWSPDYIAAEVSWSDGLGGSDHAGTYFREAVGDDFREHGGTEYREAIGNDVAVASNADRVMTVRSEDEITVSVTAYHPMMGELHILEPGSVDESGEVSVAFDSSAGSLTVSTASSTTQTGEVMIGSTVTCRLEASDGGSVTGAFIAR